MPPRHATSGVDVAARGRTWPRLPRRRQVRQSGAPPPHHARAPACHVESQMAAADRSAPAAKETRLACRRRRSCGPRLRMRGGATRSAYRGRAVKRGPGAYDRVTAEQNSRRGRSPIGRGRALKPPPVRVRVPPSPPLDPLRRRCLMRICRHRGRLRGGGRVGAQGGGPSAFEPAPGDGAEARGGCLPNSSRNSRTSGRRPTITVAASPCVRSATAPEGGGSARRVATRLRIGWSWG